MITPTISAIVVPANAQRGIVPEKGEPDCVEDVCVVVVEVVICPDEAPKLTEANPVLGGVALSWEVTTISYDEPGDIAGTQLDVKFPSHTPLCPVYAIDT